jgi:NTP pyrophosphatase (non-canonical NTP hydrolase)
MNPLEYQKLASRTECEQGKVCDRMADVYPMDPTSTGQRDLLLPVRLNHAVLGMAGEVGELAGALEKWLYYGRALDRENLIEEMGDLLWYVAQLCNGIAVDMSMVMEANIAKLRARYPEKYSDESSANRDHASEKKAMRSVRLGILYGKKGNLTEEEELAILDSIVEAPPTTDDEAAAKINLEAEADAMARAMEEEALSRGGSLTYGVADLAGAEDSEVRILQKGPAHPPACDCTLCTQKSKHHTNESRPPDHPNPFGYNDE